MAAILGLLGPYKWLVIVIAAATVFGSGVAAGLRWSKAEVVQEKLNAADAALKQANADLSKTQATLDHVQAEVAATNTKVTQALAERNVLAKALDRQRKEYNALPKSPVDPGCHLSPERMRNLQEGYDQLYPPTDSAGVQPALPGSRPASRAQRPGLPGGSE